METCRPKPRCPTHCRVTTGRNGDVGCGAFFRFLPATSTHRYALTTNSFSACVAPSGAFLLPKAKAPGSPRAHLERVHPSFRSSHRLVVLLLFSQPSDVRSWS